MSEAVLADPQYSVVRTLRPWTGFEAASPAGYQGAPANTPIQFTEGGEALDPMVGQLGYMPNLLRGIPVPFGARVALWLPTILAANIVGATFEPYRWQLTWRFKNVAEHVATKEPFHFVPNADGVANAGARIVLRPAALQSLLYNQSEPASIGRATVNAHVEDFVPQYTAIGTPPVAPIPLPIIPGGGTGAYQQGLFQAAVVPTAANNPSFLVAEYQALGDELLLGMYRNPGAPVAAPNWNFATVDAVVSQLFGAAQAPGNAGIGIYLLTGKS